MEAAEAEAVCVREREGERRASERESARAHTKLGEGERHAHADIFGRPPLTYCILLKRVKRVRIEYRTSVLTFGL